MVSGILERKVEVGEGESRGYGPQAERAMRGGLRLSSGTLNACMCLS